MYGHPLFTNSINPEIVRNTIDRELYESAIPKKEDLKINLPWRIICKMAVLAYLDKMSFNEIVERALKQYI